MIESAIYYLSSTAAQVWVSLMIFQILVLRDSTALVMAEIDSLWALARIYLSPHLRNLKDSNGKTLKNRLHEFGLSEELLVKADTDRVAFKKVIAAIKEYQLVLMDEKSVTFRERNETLSSTEWQFKLDAIADQLKRLDVNLGFPNLVHVIGLTAIAGNLVVISVAANFDSDRSRWGVVWTALIVNLIMGFFSSRSTFEILRRK